MTILSASEFWHKTPFSTNWDNEKLWLDYQRKKSEKSSCQFSIEKVAGCKNSPHILLGLEEVQKQVDKEVNDPQAKANLSARKNHRKIIFAWRAQLAKRNAEICHRPTRNAFVFERVKEWIFSRGILQFCKGGSG